tara:strand:+ start:1105 stop:1404 length:300 start_codon:yes stop_codon:yes gene_type:complete
MAIDNIYRMGPYLSIGTIGREGRDCFRRPLPHPKGVIKKEPTMHPHLEKLRQTHRRLDRAIDTMRAPARQEGSKHLKKLRLLVKDRIASVTTPRSRSGA